jgi:hypothetical protein
MLSLVKRKFCVKLRRIGIEQPAPRESNVILTEKKRKLCVKLRRIGIEQPAPVNLMLSLLKSRENGMKN